MLIEENKALLWVRSMEKGRKELLWVRSMEKGRKEHTSMQSLLWVRKEEIEENQQLRLLATAVASDGEDQAPARTDEDRRAQDEHDAELRSRSEREKGFDRWRKGERSGPFFFPNPDKKNV
ncbi:hypothetical protein LXL04_004722 [Taraxacum kok-saghyz]